ncbi:MAG: hypothetical protein AAF493_10250 [Pseudomonadota bacterium]
MLRQLLIGLRDWLEPAANRSDVSAEEQRQARIAALERELARIRDDEVVLHRMLSTSKDSFHHAIASSTEHLESRLHRAAAIEQELAELRAPNLKPQSPASST